MKHILPLFVSLIVFGCTVSHYTVYRFDNGDDYVQEGMYRIVDQKEHIGYADESGTVRIKPRFAFGFPFENGKARKWQREAKRKKSTIPTANITIGRATVGIT